MVENPLCVPVAHGFKNRTKQRLVVGKVAGSDLLRDPAAESAAEPVVAREGEKRARIGRHADEGGEDAVGRGLLQHVADAVGMVAPPPGRTKLDVAGRAFAREGTGQNGQLRMGLRIEREEYDARERPVALQQIEELRHCGGSTGARMAA